MFTLSRTFCLMPKCWLMMRALTKPQSTVSFVTCQLNLTFLHCRIFFRLQKSVVQFMFRFSIVLYSILGPGVFCFFLSWVMQLLDSFPGSWRYSGRCRAAVWPAQWEAFVNRVARYIKCVNYVNGNILPWSCYTYTHTHKITSISWKQRPKKRDWKLTRG